MSCDSSIVAGHIVRIDGLWDFWKLNPWYRKKWACKLLSEFPSKVFFHFMCVHTKMYSSAFLPLGWNVLFRSGNKNIRWRKFCFAPKSERNIWKGAVERETQRGRGRGRERVHKRWFISLRLYGCFFFTVCKFCTACWDGIPLYSVSRVEFQSDSYLSQKKTFCEVKKTRK